MSFQLVASRVIFERMKGDQKKMEMIEPEKEWAAEKWVIDIL